MKKSTIRKLVPVLVVVLLLVTLGFCNSLVKEKQSLVRESQTSSSTQVSESSRQVPASSAVVSQENLLPPKEVSTTTKNIADPAGLFYKGKYYSYSTSTSGIWIPVAVSTDNKNYKVTYDALSHRPSWSEGGLWAPDIFYNGKDFILYFSGKNKDTGKRALGLAKSKSPSGPFIPEDHPLLSNDSLGGLIDPEEFQDTDKKRYLLYKNDGNSIGIDSQIWIQELDSAGEKIISSPKSLLVNTSISNPENNGDNDIASTIEAPSLIKAPDGTYVLFFSGNNYGTPYYFTGYATSKNIFGPYNYQGPLLTTSSQVSGNQIVGPGGVDIVKKDTKDTYLVLHGWVNGVGTSEGAVREIYVRKLTWKDGHIPQVSLEDK